MIASLHRTAPRSKLAWLIPVIAVAGVAVDIFFSPKTPAPAAMRSGATTQTTRGPAVDKWADNPDLAALPEIFAIHAEAAEWTGDHTVFEYWHPGIKDYGYFFEATRVAGGYRFRAIPEPRLNEADQYWDTSLGEGSLIRFLRSIPVVPPLAPSLSNPAPAALVTPLPVESRPAEKKTPPGAPDKLP
jgi:hypothetical protein